MKENTCFICGNKFPADDLIKGSAVRDQVSDLIVKDFPKWTADDYICEADLGKYRLKYIDSIMHDESGSLSELDREVFNRLKENEIVSKNIEEQFDHKWTFGEKLSDKIAEFGGSWAFIIVFSVFMAFWVMMNVGYLLFKPFDPYPFILLNLTLSTLAAVQAPIIMMSQNRQEAKDRLRSQHDYKVNLKSEIEIRTLHEKVDHLLTHQWEKLVQIQKLQMELLTELVEKKKNN